MTRILVTNDRRRLAVMLFGLLALTACAGAASSATVDAPHRNHTGVVLLDVRSPAEFAASHLEGAVNLNVEAPDFTSRVAELDPAATYQVYCRSGRRSAIAVDIMASLGFGNVRDLGGLDEAAEATGLPFVTP